jgi:hypothetical protein
MKRILEYENLGLFVKFSNSGYSLTEYEDDATTFGKPMNDLDLKNTRRFIDNQLCNKEPFYEKGHLVIVEI